MSNGAAGAQSSACATYDVPVVDLFGKGERGTYVGDSFATQIVANTGTGNVMDNRPPCASRGRVPP